MKTAARTLIDKTLFISLNIAKSRIVGHRLFGTKIGFQFCAGTALAVGQVADNDTVLQQCDARGDVYRVLQIVAGDEDGGTRLLLVVSEQVLQDQLRGGVEEVEGLVEDDRRGAAE